MERSPLSWLPAYAAASAVLRAACALGLVLALMRCDVADPVPRDALVVEMFLETGAPLPDVVLRQARALNNPATGSEDAAPGATITLTLAGDSIAYAAVPDAPGRYQPVGGPEVVPVGADFTLTVAWEDVRAFAEGQTPPRVTLTEVCLSIPDRPVEAILVDSVRRDSLDIPARQGFLYTVDVMMAWTEAPSSRRPYWVRGQLRPSTSLQSGGRVVDFFLQPAVVRPEADFRSTNEGRRWTGVYAVPVDSSDAPLPNHALTVDVVRGGRDFGAFATSRTDPETRAPTSNVTNALGIATALSLDSLRTDVDSTGTRCYTPPPSAPAARNPAP